MPLPVISRVLFYGQFVQENPILPEMSNGTREKRLKSIDGMQLKACIQSACVELRLRADSDTVLSSLAKENSFADFRAHKEFLLPRKSQTD
jgi:hypothetical protein